MEFNSQNIVSVATACPYFHHVDENENEYEKKENEQEKVKDENSISIPTRVEWDIINSSPSNYYVVKVIQENNNQTSIIHSTNETKQFTHINILPEIKADIIVTGYSNNPEINSNQDFTDRYKTTYTVKREDSNTYTYTNKTFTVRHNKSSDGSILYESSTIEGVYSVS